MHGRNTTLIQRYFPSYRSPKQRYQAVVDELVKPDTVWLELGCGKRICADDKLNQGLPQRARFVVGVDLDPTVGQVAHPARHPEPIGLLTRGVAVPDSLDAAGDDSTTGDHEPHSRVRRRARLHAGSARSLVSGATAPIPDATGGRDAVPRTTARARALS